MAVFSFVRIVFKKVFVLFLTISALVLIILGFPLLVPVYILRLFASYTSIFFRPDLKKILTCRSSILAVDDMYTKPRATLVVSIFFGGKLDLTESRKFFQEKLIEKRTSNGELARPELTQYISRWMGFDFWKEDENFDIANHVYNYEGPLKENSYDEFKLYEIVNQLTCKPFLKNQSPWEFVLLYNCKKDQNDESEIATNCMLFRVHHSLADGFSILSLMTELIKSSKGSLEPMIAKSIQQSVWKQVLQTLAVLILGPFEIVESLVEAYDSNEWHSPVMKLSGSIKGGVYDRIPVASIKTIKNAYGVSFTSVIFAAMAGAIRNLMIEDGVKIPEKIHCLAPFPMPGHSGKLRNLMTIGYATLPIGMPDPEQRLKTIHRNLLKLRKSTAPILMFELSVLIGGLFPWMIKLLTQQILVTSVISSFPGPSDEVTYLGIPVTDMMFVGGLLPGNIGVGFTSISYNGYLRIAGGMDQSIIPENIPVKTLIENVAQEFEVLLRSVMV